MHASELLEHLGRNVSRYHIHDHVFSTFKWWCVIRPKMVKLEFLILTYLLVYQAIVPIMSFWISNSRNSYAKEYTQSRNYMMRYTIYIYILTKKCQLMGSIVISPVTCRISKVLLISSPQIDTNTKARRCQAKGNDK